MRAYLNEGKALTESFCQRCTGKFDFSHMTSFIYLEKTLRYGLERETGDLHFKFGPILINTDRVLSSYADNELGYCTTAVCKRMALMIVNIISNL